MRQGLTGERLWALFLLGLVLLLPPLVSVFDRAVLVGGIPLLFLYLFVAWVGLIVLTAVVVERPAAENNVDGEPGATDTGDDRSGISSGHAGTSGA